MGIARPGTLAALATLACLAATPAVATTGVLYKSVDERGVVTFSDVPPAEGVRILEARKIPSGNGGGTYATYAQGTLPGWSEEALEGQWLDSDVVLAKANAELDAAESALAEARRATSGPTLGPVGLVRSGPRATMLEYDRIEREKRRVRLARQRLLEVMRERRLAMSVARSP